jgi:acetoin utilization deacetylase AcuC-like enzyme
MKNMPKFKPKIHLVYAPQYKTDLTLYGFDKPFALDRGQQVLDKLNAQFPDKIAVAEPRPVSEADILLVHGESYRQSLNEDATWRQIFELKEEDLLPGKATLPLHKILDDFKLKVGGTILAATIALQEGLAANLGAGYHHAFPNQGRGFCAINDIAIAIKSLQKQKLVEKVMVVDVDFHQGDGTAYIFAGDSSVFTLSIHSQEGWPPEKQTSSLDVPVYYFENHLYLDKLQKALQEALSKFQPDLVIYVAGSDPYERDVLPGTRFLKLTLAEMRQRDRMVIDLFAGLKVPLAMVFSGGYGPDVWEVHYWATRHLLEKAGALK